MGEEVDGDAPAPLRWFISPSVSALQEDKPVRAEGVREGGRLKESGGVSV